jgi:2-polyprenyl-6-methoxyphenol hydroxylase-like FAD-dependent oxidoreductase
VRDRGDFDVVIAGASLAGCSAARLFALRGARVALVERRPDPDAYKVVCTHTIQPSAVAAIERLGLAPLMEAAGAARVRPAAWTPHGGWLRFPAASPRGFGLSRRRLDPILRQLAASTPGVELIPGQAVVGLRHDGDRVTGADRSARRQAPNDQGSSHCGRRRARVLDCAPGNGSGTHS